MNIAVLIGVSDYKVAAPLPACTADVEHMRRLLTSTRKYDDICCLTKQTASSPLKEDLRAFFTKYQTITGISEALIYFSGHGVYHTDALLCCSDFDPSRPATTSISNEELDDLLRSVAPSVAVKVIDACQSGSPYIKDASAGFEKALRTSRLKSFVCMASSRQEQSSYATAEASAFTAKWVDAALSKQEGTVLYRDIQAALADAFVSNPDQTPFFVTQGTGLEAFAVVTDEMRRMIAERSNTTPTGAPEGGVEGVVAALVARMDEAYVSASEAETAVERAGDELDQEALSQPLVAHFYQKRISREGLLGGLPRVRSVAEFAQEQGWSKKYFVDVIEENYKVKVPRSTTSFLFGVRPGPEDFDTLVRSRPQRLKSTQPLPFEVVEVTFDACGHPSLRAFSLIIGIVHSLTEVMVLSAIVRLTQKGWTDRSPELSEIQWRYQSHSWKDVVAQPRLIWETAFLEAQEAIKSYIDGLLPKKEESLPVADSSGSDRTSTDPGR